MHKISLFSSSCFFLILKRVPKFFQTLHHDGLMMSKCSDLDQISHKGRNKVAIITYPSFPLHLHNEMNFGKYQESYGEL